MPVDLSDTLVVGISSTALFDLNEADKVFRTKFKEDKDTAISEYRAYMLEREGEPLSDGTGMLLVEALLKLNKYKTKMMRKELLMDRHAQRAIVKEPPTDKTKIPEGH